MGLAHSPRIVTDGLVLCLDAANPKSYPGSGTTWFDLSGKSNHATLYNSPIFSNGVVIWDGISEYAEITANQSSLDFRTEQTVLIWMKHTFTSGRRNPWDQAYGGYGTWTHEQGNNINYYYGDAGSNTTPYTALNSGGTDRSVWNLMAVTRNISLVTWYKNGIQTSNQNNPYADQPTTAANIRIARGYAGYWEGEMSTVLAYNRTLTIQEIQQNFNATRGRYGI